MIENRKYNFSAGPAALPEAVLKRIQNELFNYQQSGASILELSHRGEKVRAMFEECISRFKKLLAIGDSYQVLLLHGGASSAFFQIPMNLLSKDDTADYIDTGAWSSKAIEEAKRFGTINIAASSESENYSCIPKEETIRFSPDARYRFLCSNNTIFGTQWKKFPDPKGSFLVGDFSSDILSRKVDITPFGIVFGGVQKNLAPAGLAFLIIRNDVLEMCREDIPSMCSYKLHAKKESMINTPPVFPVYVMNCTFEWIEAEGGLGEIEKRNNEKAQAVYEAIDRFEIYHSPVQDKNDRSAMNIVFTLPSEEQNKEFLSLAKEEEFLFLKGHRSIGGIRASIYNAFPMEGIERFISFLNRFASKY